MSRILFLCILCSSLLTGCASEESNYQLQRRLDRRNNAYANYIKRREMRLQARDERFDSWSRMILN